jgi:hypothetical protein
VCFVIGIGMEIRMVIRMVRTMAKTTPIGALALAICTLGCPFDSVNAADAPNAPNAAPASSALREVHGQSDAFAGDGIAIAWAVFRGPSDDNAQVVLSIAADHARYGSVAVDGVDRSGGQRRSRVSRTALTVRDGAATAVMRIPRSQFADAPKSEFRFFGPGPAGEPRLVVFYLGVPDMTPEFDDPQKLAAFLSTRIDELASRAIPR